MYVKIIAKSSCATCTTRFQINLGLEKQKKIMFNKVGGEKIFSSGIKKKTSGMKWVSGVCLLTFNPFMTEAVIVYKPVHWFAEPINGLVSIW